MKCLVTGGTGFVGQGLCSELAHRGYTVVVASRSAPQGLRTFEQRSVGPMDGSTEWCFALGGQEVVFHLAARVHVLNDESIDPLVEFRKSNVAGTLNLAKQSAAAGIRRFIFLSSVKVCGEFTEVGRAFSESDIPSPQDAYGLSKLEAELGLRRLAQETGMEVVIIRPPLVYGPGVRANFAALMGAVQRGWPLPLGAVHNQRSLVALHNLLDLIVICADHPQAANQTFFVSDGQDLSTRRLVEGLARASGVSARLLSVPVWMLRKAAVVFDKEDSVERLCGNLQVDISKARSLLGWKPPMSVDEGLRRACERSL